MPRPIQRRLPLVAIFLSFRVIWGGGGGGHPPPGRAKVAQTPGRAWVIAAPVAVIPVNTFCWSKSAEHDVTVTSLTVDPL